MGFFGTNTSMASNRAERISHVAHTLHGNDDDSSSKAQHHERGHWSNLPLPRKLPELWKRGSVPMGKEGNRLRRSQGVMIQSDHFSSKRATRYTMCTKHFKILAIMAGLIIGAIADGPKPSGPNEE